LVILLVVICPVDPEEVDPGPDLLNQLVQRLLMLAVVARGLLAKLKTVSALESSYKGVGV
jgi:hypothetical protein